MRAYQLKPPIKTQLVELCCSSLEAVYHHSSSCPSPPWSPPHLYNRPPIWSPFCWSSRLFLAQKKVPITIIGTMQVNCPGLEKHHSLKSGLTGRIYIYSVLPSQFSKTDTGFSLQIIGEKSWKCDLRDTFKVWISASDLKKKKEKKNLNNDNDITQPVSAQVTCYLHHKGHYLSGQPAVMEEALRGSIVQKYKSCMQNNQHQNILQVPKIKVLVMRNIQF